MSTFETNPSMIPSQTPRRVLATGAGTELDPYVPTITAAGQARTYVGYDYASGQALTTGASAVRSTAISAPAVLLHAKKACYFRVGNSAVTATNGAGSIPLEDGEKIHIALTSGEYISVIQDAASGSFSIVPVLS